MSDLKRHIRHASLWLSFIHACMVLILVPIAVLGQAYLVASTTVFLDPKFSTLSYMQQIWQICEVLMKTQPSFLHEFISGFAAIYYVVDLFLIWINIHPIDLMLKVWYTFHHVLCFIGLTAPVFYYSSTWDMDLAYGGYFVGEISNPPRCIVDLLEFQLETIPPPKPRTASPATIKLFGRDYHISHLKRWMRTAAQFHLILFIIFRFVGIHFFVTVVIPYAQYSVTSWMGGTTLALSLMAMVVMIQNASKPVETLEQPLKVIKKEQ